MALDESSKSSLLKAKLLNMSFLVAILIYMIILAYWISLDSTSESLLEGEILAMLTAVLAVLSIACILCGNYIARLAIRKSRNPSNILFTHTIRISFFQAVAIFGLILGLIDGSMVSWAFTLPFLLAAAVALVLTFPTEEKWERMLQQTETHL
ncbi:hypothetical protein ACFLTS_02625 [Chloroflexota bacterium]